MTATPRFLTGLREIAADYDHILLDQWGVLHNGEVPYEGVPEALAALRRAGKRLTVITNSGRPGAQNRSRLPQFGLRPEQVDAMVSSGDVALDWLRREAPQSRCFAVCSGSDAAPLAEAGQSLAERVEEADLIYISGMPAESDRLDMAPFEPWIEAGLARGLTLVCANPDHRGPQGDRILLSPGTIAAIYEERGGRVLSFGKPGPEIFRRAMALHPEIEPARCLMIGDMPETDLAGAAASGIDGAWVLGGIHAGDLEGAADKAARQALALAILERAGTPAAWVLATLRW